MKPDEETCRARGVAGGAWSFPALPGRATLPMPPCAHQPGSSLNPIAQGSYGELAACGGTIGLGMEVGR